MQQNDKMDWEKYGMLEGLSREDAAECSVFLNNIFSLLQRYKQYEQRMKFEYCNAIPMARRFYSKIRKVYSKDFLEVADSMYYKNTCLHSTKLTGIKSFEFNLGDLIAYNGLDAECEWIQIIIDEVIVKDFIKKIEQEQMSRHFSNRPAIKKMYLHSVWISPLAEVSDCLGVGFNGAYIE